MTEEHREVGTRVKGGAVTERGNRIRALRLRAGLTQEMVARAVEVSVQSVRSWEAVRYSPTEANAQSLSRLFGVPNLDSRDESTDTVSPGVKRGSQNRVRVDAKVLRAARRDVAMTQEEVATQSGVERTSISRYESGRSMPAEPTLRALAQIYNRLPEEFLAK